VLSIESNGIIRLGPVAQQTRLRLMGVDGAGKETTRLLEKLLKGKSVYVEYEPGKRPGEGEDRAPAYLFRAPDGLFINLELITRGYARTTTQTPFQFSALFLDREQEASAKGLGLWANDRPSANDAKVASSPPAQTSTVKRRPKRPANASNSARLEVDRALNQAMNDILRSNSPSANMQSNQFGPTPGPMIVMPPPMYYQFPPFYGPVIVPVPTPSPNTGPTFPQGAPVPSRPTQPQGTAPSSASGRSSASGTQKKSQDNQGSAPTTQVPAIIREADRPR
jgi:hypothetical protein